MSDCIQKVNRISGKAGDGLSQYNVDFPGFAVGNHAVELRAVICFCSGDAIIRIDPGIFPGGILLDQAAVITDLCRKGVL